MVMKNYKIFLKTTLIIEVKDSLGKTSIYKIGVLCIKKRDDIRLTFLTLQV